MSGSDALGGFLEKWRARWPEWRLAEVFVPLEQRERVVAWFALLQEFDDILNIAGDPLPADAKLGWWGTELRDWAGHRSRHPLGRLLEPVEAPWSALADALPALVAARARAADGGAALAALAGYAQAVVAVEAAVLGGPRAEPRALAAQVLATRLAEAGLQAVPQARQPVDTEATAGRESAQREWAGELLAVWPARVEGAPARRMWAAFARHRLARFADGQLPRPASRWPLRTLWQAWRAAQG
ncbi:squalene/phytoene synthase family protein [Pseudoxanthomonas daejeonensis]|uniref:Phytoene/squalene synthase family protein n=1 Tax=Pseudoxanthomonas daejeonensis TaxID=266062 RepID=A0ABQ6Z8Z4_9GAMM|nr:squalene/phytoene synthase family protein [Pseudoxanthomonas daejeonensis]KAF1695956.1 phytoene/squalene synthase family protein [Pseudoxanthomonas daejeonensis]